MKRHLILALLLSVGCAGPDNSETDTGVEDAGAPDASNRVDAAVVDQGTNTQPDSSTTTDVGEPACDVTLEVQSGIAIGSTQTEPIAAGSQPVICWTLEAGAAQPGDGGWHVRVEREENAGGEMTEWVAQGIPSDLRQVRFGDCAGDATCTTATTLAAGSHFFSVWDEADPNRVGGTVVVTVQ